MFFSRHAFLADPTDSKSLHTRPALITVRVPLRIELDPPQSVWRQPHQETELLVAAVRYTSATEIILVTHRAIPVK
jgi:hypothetical protein